MGRGKARRKKLSLARGIRIGRVQGQLISACTAAAASVTVGALEVECARLRSLLRKHGVDPSDKAENAVRVEPRWEKVPNTIECATEQCGEILDAIRKGYDDVHPLE